MNYPHDVFVDQVLCTSAELDITVSMDAYDDIEVFLNKGSHPITDLLDPKLLEELTNDWKRRASKAVDDEFADRGDWEYEEWKDRRLDQ